MLSRPSWANTGGLVSHFDRYPCSIRINKPRSIEKAWAHRHR